MIKQIKDNEDTRKKKLFLDKVNFSSELYQSKYLNITLIWNEGIAFGLLSFNQNSMYNLLSLLIILFIVTGGK